MEKWGDFTKAVVEANEPADRYIQMYNFFEGLLGSNLPEVGNTSISGWLRISHNVSGEPTRNTLLELRISRDADFPSLYIVAFTGIGSNSQRIYEKSLPAPKICSEKEIKELANDEILTNIYGLLKESPVAIASFTDAPSKDHA